MNMVIMIEVSFTESAHLYKAIDTGFSVRHWVVRPNIYDFETLQSKVVILIFLSLTRRNQLTT